MSTRTTVLHYLGALFAVCAVGSTLLLFFGATDANRWWIGSCALSAGWIFGGFAIGPSHWARTAVPAAVIGLFAWFYTRDQGLDAAASVLIAAAVAATALHVIAMKRLSRLS